MIRNMTSDVAGVLVATKIREALDALVTYEWHHATNNKEIQEYIARLSRVHVGFTEYVKTRENV